jgi:neopullulanase
LPKFNSNTPAVREFIYGIAEHWIRFGIDGWRLDVPAEISDDSFWQEFRSRVRSANSQAYIVGEIWHDARRWLQGDQFDASMNYPLTAACLGFFPGRHLDLAEALKVAGFHGQLRPMDAQTFADRIDWCLGLYPPEVTSVLLNPLDSHDTPRFLTCARGDIASLQLALTFLFTYPGAPCLFYGDEIGLSGAHDPDCRQAFLWSESSWNHELHEFTRDLISLRRSRRVLRRGDFRRLYSAEGVFAFERRLKSESIVTILNVDDETREVALVVTVPPSQSPRILSGQAEIAPGPVLHVRVPGRNGVVMELGGDNVTV